MSTAQPQATTCDQACGEGPVAEEGRSPGVLDSVLAVAYCMFFVAVAVAGSLWLMADLSATLIPKHHV
jgi:hypothetical protein